jgi:lytic cellulose monooxygenase (C1-hydroxylating)
MSLITFISLLPFLGALPSLVSAHGHVTNIIVNGQDFPGFPSDDPGGAPPSSIAWKVDVPDNTFTRDYSSPDIICHKLASPGQTSASVPAGGTVEFQWTHWPAHQGPVVDYMAACPGKCEDAQKMELKWFKIAEQGLVSQTGCNEKGNTGCWALDKLIQAGNKWSVKVPSDLKAGNYVMRHEAINLDFPGQSQNYPACVNLVVTGGGSSLPEGVAGTSLYTGQEPGLNFNIYDLKSAEYPIPGPPIATGGGEGGYYANNSVDLASDGGAPASGASAPASSESAPASGASAPASGASAPASGESAPVSGESAPASGESAPVSGETAPASGETAPASGETAPASGASAPESDETAPESDETAPESDETDPESDESENECESSGRRAYRWVA